MSRIRTVYGLLSLLILLLGMVIYLLFRDFDNMIIFFWIKKPEFLKNSLIPLKSSIITDILKYNIPDMLWLVSAILLFRFIWLYKNKIQTVYIICFYLIGSFYEISQLSGKVPGTFDWLDLLFFGIGAFVEGLLNKNFILRRCL